MRAWKEKEQRQLDKTLEALVSRGMGLGLLGMSPKAPVPMELDMMVRCAKEPELGIHEMLQKTALEVMLVGRAWALFLGRE